MHEKNLKLALLTALCDEWLARFEYHTIGSDVEKILLLRWAAQEVDLSTAALPASVEELYKEVFLRSFSEVREDPRMRV